MIPTPDEETLSLSLANKIIAAINDAGFTPDDNFIVLNTMILLLAQLCFDADANGELAAKAVCDRWRNLKALPRHSVFQ
jgi:hypothetical protein